ncbi:unnamed protein product [Polarella glacialis]|uniref:Uncharacterized protein n=1 Tax=Polarella glacialis TaxID=89957 RepID=A0A813DN61_POLGL|nr:unnamed protein product [Polarella glacialis]
MVINHNESDAAVYIFAPKLDRLTPIQRSYDHLSQFAACSCLQQRCWSATVFLFQVPAVNTPFQDSCNNKQPNVALSLSMIYRYELHINCLVLNAGSYTRHVDTATQHMQMHL